MQWRVHSTTHDEAEFNRARLIHREALKEETVAIVVNLMKEQARLTELLLYENAKESREEQVRSRSRLLAGSTQLSELLGVGLLG